MNELIYWIWLSLRCGAGSELGSYLLKHFKSPKDIYEADEEALLSLDGITEQIAEVLLDRDLSYPEKIMTYCQRMNVGILTLDDAIYPDRLREIHAKPIVLYYRGRIPDLDDNVLIACVGMRKCSEQGKENAYHLGYDLADAGAIVVSGMALGIDAASQLGALDAGGHTIAVLGCGIDRAYPPENKNLMERIAEKGTILTEFAPGSEPNGKNFPIRNRIISGLSQGTVVVEAGMRSGSLITAQGALRQGRDLFAFPGKANDPCSEGTNDLIKNGAKFVTSAFDVLVEYEALYPHRISTETLIMAGRRGKVTRAFEKMLAFEAPERYLRKSESTETTGEKPVKKGESKKKGKTPVSPKAENREKKPDLSALSETERLVLSVMSRPMSAEEISAVLFSKEGAYISPGELLGMMTLLEINGYVEAIPGGGFRAR